MLDKRIGKYGEYAPKICAASGKQLQSGSIGHALTGVFYCRVNAGNVLTDDLRTELLRVVTPKRSSKSSEEK